MLGFAFAQRQPTIFSSLLKAQALQTLQSFTANSAMDSTTMMDKIPTTGPMLSVPVRRNASAISVSGTHT